MSAVEVLATGPLATVQDLGRPGHAGWGVGVSGAADRRALRLGNRLVGNPEGAAGVEATFGGLALRPDSDVVLAVTGARCAATVDARPVGHDCLVTVRAGSVLRLDKPSAGLRAYVAVRGGLAVDPVLGSRSTDLLSGLGPPVLTAGTLLPVGPPPARFPCVEVAPVADPPVGDLRLSVLLGPRADWFTPAALHALTTATWTVSPDSNRIGARLTGPRLERAGADELPSEGVVRGAVQVPPDGLPILFLADHPVTGGYPVAAVVLDADLDLAAQARPGQRLHFQPVRGA